MNMPNRAARHHAMRALCSSGVSWRASAGWVAGTSCAAIGCVAGALMFISAVVDLLTHPIARAPRNINPRNTKCRFISAIVQPLGELSLPAATVETFERSEPILHWRPVDLALVKMTAISPAKSPVRPMFLADWRDALFVHFRVKPAALAPLVPLPLDLFDSNAFVSLVAFTQDRLRPAIGRGAGEFLARPIARHTFLN